MGIAKSILQKHGIEFWSERASFTSANNLVICACVELFLSFLKDQRAQIDPDLPIYFIELGSGSGCFAYRFIQEFFARKLAFPETEGLNVRYVVTDFIPEIVSIWRSNPFFKSFVDEGMLDFAVFDPACDQSISTTCSGWTINAQSIGNTPVFIANSLFDTIGVDGFRFLSGKVEERLVSTEADPHDPLSSLVNNALAIHQSAGDVIRFPYYANREFDQVLKEYCDLLPSGVLTIPIRALEILQNLRALTLNKMALLCCSRGFTDVRYAEISKELQYHDLSFPLNFDAIKRYFAIIGGELLLPENHDDTLVKNCLSFGFVLPEKQQAGLERTRIQYPISASRLVNASKEIQQKMSRWQDNSSAISAIGSFVELVGMGEFDPSLFLRCMSLSMDAIEKELPEAPQSDVTTLLHLLRRVDSSIYTFNRAIPEPVSDSDVFPYLIRVWQRASSAHHQQTGRAFFAIDE